MQRYKVKTPHSGKRLRVYVSSKVELAEEEKNRLNNNGKIRGRVVFVVRYSVIKKL